MTKGKLIEILKNSAKVNELTKDKAYIIQVEVGDMPKESLLKFVNSLAEKIKSLGIKNIIIAPTNKELGVFSFYEVKNDSLSEVK